MHRAHCATRAACGHERVDGKLMNEIEHVAAAALGSLLASAELRAASMARYTDDEIRAEFERRFPDGSPMVDSDLLEKVNTAISEEKLSIEGLLNTINEYELDDSTVKDCIRKLCESADIALAEDINYQEIIIAASFVAFGSFASWPDDIRKLSEEFKKEGFYRPVETRELP
jgi:hypothetical protein